ncbi:YolD-like family protein [Ferdinandcohnia sp. SAFN-114]|uniref:YolD-like family protein n=1 Tax=Ferdinandcohnia sp. SAFN-114 TaxID=3387275 RepID=UPI003F7F28E0
MIKDRGKIKWIASFILPEMVASYSRIDWDNKKVEKPILDEHQLEEINQTICSAMEYNEELIFTLYYNGGFQLLIGKVHFVDPLTSELSITDYFEDIHKVRFEDIINVCKNNE